MKTYTYQLILILSGAFCIMSLPRSSDAGGKGQTEKRSQFRGSCDPVKQASCSSNAREMNVGYNAYSGKLKGFEGSDDKPCLHCGGGCCDPVEKRIAHGTKAKTSEFPWSAALFQRKENAYVFFCGGVLIKPDVVLTAAHCVERFLDAGVINNRIELYMDVLKVSIGENDIHIDQNGIRRRNTSSLHNARTIILHPKFRTSINDIREPDWPFRYDVALLRLDEATDKPLACLHENFGRRSNVTQHICFGFGHGRTSANSPPSRKLMKVPVLLYEVDECEPALASQTSQYFCARSEIGLTVGCKMDSGSPVVCRSEPSNPCSPYFVSGIFSFRRRGDRCRGRHNVLTNMLNPSLHSANRFVMDAIDLVSEQEDFLDVYCRD